MGLRPTARPPLHCVIAAYKLHGDVENLSNSISQWQCHAPCFVALALTLHPVMRWTARMPLSSFFLLVDKKPSPTAKSFSLVLWGRGEHFAMS